MRKYLSFKEIGESIAEYYISSNNLLRSYGEFVADVYLPELDWPELKQEKDEGKVTMMLFDLANRYV